jgi:hypothetical protein
VVRGAVRCTVLADNRDRGSIRADTKNVRQRPSPQFQSGGVLKAGGDMRHVCLLAAAAVAAGALITSGAEQTKSAMFTGNPRRTMFCPPYGFPVDGPGYTITVNNCSVNMFTAALNYKFGGWGY